MNTVLSNIRQIDQQISYFEGIPRDIFEEVPAFLQDILYRYVRELKSKKISLLSIKRPEESEEDYWDRLSILYPNNQRYNDPDLILEVYQYYESIKNPESEPETEPELLENDAID